MGVLKKIKRRTAQEKRVAVQQSLKENLQLVSGAIISKSDEGELAGSQNNQLEERNVEVSTIFQFFFQIDISFSMFHR